MRPPKASAEPFAEVLCEIGVLSHLLCISEPPSWIPWPQTMMRDTHFPPSPRPWSPWLGLWSPRCPDLFTEAPVEGTSRKVLSM